MCFGLRAHVSPAESAVQTVIQPNVAVSGVNVGEFELSVTAG